MEIPYEVTPRRDTGLFNSKLGIWLFLASEVMLFGGLFSAYVFLRVGVIEGVDPPWPWGINVHKTFVVIGFVNTIVLIVSSVFVVFGWVALKERNWGRFQMFMYMTVACAAIFMALKTVEYRSKLTQHHDIRLHDNAVLEGKVLNRSFRVPFEAKSVRFDLNGSIPGFIYDVEGDFPALEVKWKDAEGKDQAEKLNSLGEFKSWFAKHRGAKTRELVAKRKDYRKGDLESVQVAYQASAEAEAPFQIQARRRRVLPVVKSEGEGGDTLTYNDGCALTGVAGDDRVVFEPHYLDMQLVPEYEQKTSEVWEILGDDHMKQAWMKNREDAFQEMEAHFEGRPIPERILRGYFINLQSLHDKSHAKSFWEEFIHEFKAGAGIGQAEAADHAEGDHHDDGDHHAKGDEKGKGHAADDHHAAEDDHGHGEHHVVKIPRDKIKFLNSHGPRNNNYYAIYFTMTALHGLHVIGGALVLLYFVVFGKKLFLKNPEHLANRVEVGGLFWHFVDLIWIFLFPLMYLL